MEEKHFSEHIEEHVEFLPVEWRSKLSLDGGVWGVFKAVPAYTLFYLLLWYHRLCLKRERFSYSFVCLYLLYLCKMDSFMLFSSMVIIKVDM